METLKVAFVDFWPEIKDEDIFTPILKKHFNVIEDNINPDVIFHSIFGPVKKSLDYKCKKILFLKKLFPFETVNEQNLSNFS